MADDPPNPPALWDDNPAELDLLGFDAVVAPIVDAIVADDLDPLTIGVHARWGGGKSTVLRLISRALDPKGDLVVLQTNPWEYDDHEDVKGTLVGEVLDELQEHFDADAGLKDKVAQLLGRISWSRVGSVLASGAITQHLDLPQLAEALTPKPKDSVDSMAGFKDSFAELVGSLPSTRRVVVLVDDLDRCTPSAVMSTLEGIKLFLSVPGMVFVLAADQDMVRDAIALNLGGSPEAGRFAQRYLDKIVQLPVSLPVLPTHEAEGYLGLLLARPEMSEEAYSALVAHAADRRRAGKAPLLSDMATLTDRPSEDVLRLASQFVHGLRSDRIVNPREIKRFLNAFQVRRRMAEVRGASVRPDVLAKLLLLEDRFKSDFEALVNTPDLERKALLETWRQWAHGAGDRPEGVSEESREWATADPDLVPEQIGPYLTLAASLAVYRQADVIMDADLAALVADLVNESEVLRRTAVDQLTARSEEDQRAAVDHLLAHARQHDDASTAIRSLIEIGVESAALAADVAAGLKENCWQQFDAGAAVDLATADVPVFKMLSRQLADDDSVDGAVSQAARNVLDGDAG